MQLELPYQNATEHIVPGMTLLRGFCTLLNPATELGRIITAAPARSMRMTNGAAMSVATTSAGRYGWISNDAGHAYCSVNPTTLRPWPVQPEGWRIKAVEAALCGGFAAFAPDTCLINTYRDRARMGLHQDRNEADLAQPVVSFSFGASATFFFVPAGTRTGKTRSIELHHGDALVFGGPARMLYHGVRPLRATTTQSERTNLTFRRVAP